MLEPLDTLLPKLEEAVEGNRECAAISRYTPPQLRELVYGLVRRYRDDPMERYRTLARAAQSHHGDLMSARETATKLRCRLLERLRDVLAPVLPSLLGPIVTAYTFEVGSQRSDRRERARSTPREETHPLLRGVELVNGTKKFTADRLRQDKPGSSWWIVALAPEHPTDAVDPRFAEIVYSGELELTDEEDDSMAPGDLYEVTGQVHLRTTDEVAEQLRDSQLQAILKTVHERLVTVAEGTLVDRKQAILRSALAIQEAERAMRQTMTSTNGADR